MQLKITYPRATVRSFYPSPHLLVLFSEVVMSLFVTYIYYILTDILIYHIVYSQHSLILSASICFFLQSHQKNGKVLLLLLDIRLYKKRWISCIVRSAFKSCSGCLPVLPSADVLI